MGEREREFDFGRVEEGIMSQRWREVARGEKRRVEL